MSWVDELPEVLTPGEVAVLFRVDGKTVTRWAKPRADGSPPRLRSFTTPGGHRRYRREDVAPLLRIEGRVDDAG